MFLEFGMSPTNSLLHSQVVNQWETNNSQMPKQKKIDESRTSALRFCELILHYSKSGLNIITNCLKRVLKVCFFSSLVGRQKFVREVLNAAPVVRESEEEAERERLHFYKPAANAHTPERQTCSSTNRQAEPSRHNVKKRQRQSERCDGSRQSPPTKRLPSSALTAEDIDLLNSY